MLVDRDYILEKPRGPSVPKKFFDQRVVPLAVDASGALEVALVRAADRSGVRPYIILSVSLAALTLSALAVLRRKPAHGANSKVLSQILHDPGLV